jgi:hypothetical protein
MPLTRPTTPEEAEERLRNAFVLDDFGDVGGEVEDFPIPDKKSFLKTSATSAWAQGVIGSPVSPYQVGWQGQKDGIVRSYFNEKDASGVSDDDLFSKIAEDYKAKDALAEAARNAAARGESWLGKFREVEQTMPTVAGGRQSSYLGLAREVHDKFREKILPYQNIIRSVAEKARSIETSPEGMDWSGMAQELIQVPKESRPFVLEAISRQATANIDANAASRLGKEFARGFERFLDTAMSGSYNVLAAAGQYSEIPLAPETPQEIEARKARESQDADLMDLRDDIRDISTGKLAKLEDVRLLGMNISGAARNVPMTIGAFVPYIGPAALVGSFQRETANELRRANPTMSRETIEGIATISAPFQALTEVVSDRLLFGKLPNLKRLFTTPAFSAGGIAAQLAGRVALGTATEYAEEFTQGAVPKIVQSLSSDVPDVDWDGYFQDFKDQSPELLATIIPLALFGAGVGQATDYRASVQMLYSADEMMAAKIPAEEARKISELATTGKRPEAESLFRQEFRKAATKGEAPAEMRAAAQRVIAANQAQKQTFDDSLGDPSKFGVNMYRDAEGWKVETYNGSIIKMESAEAAARYVHDLKLSFEEYQAETVIALADDLVKAFPGTRLEFSPSQLSADKENGLVLFNPVTGQKTVLKDAKALENLWKEASAISFDSGNAPQYVLGQNFMEFSQSIARVFRDVSGRVNSVPQAITAMHEVIEAAWKKGLVDGAWSVESTRQIIATLVPTLESGIAKLGKKAQAQELLWLENAKKAVAEGNEDLIREVFSEMAVRTWIGRDSDGNKTGLRPGTILRALDAAVLQEKSPENVTTYQRLRAWFKAVGAYLKGVVATAKIIRDAERNGTIDDFTGFLDKVLGIETATREENEVKDGVIDMAFSLAPELKDGSTFSLAPTEIIGQTGLSPAISVKGKPYTGRIGMTHAEILGDYVWRKIFTPQQRRDDPNQDNAIKYAHESWMDSPDSGFDDFGFLDALTGKVFDREASYKLLKDRGFTTPDGSYSTRYESLDSSDLFNSKPVGSTFSLAPTSSPEEYSVEAFHGTDSRKFDQFDILKLGKGSGNEGLFSAGFYFSPSSDDAKSYGKHLASVGLKVKNPLVVPDSFPVMMRGDDSAEYWAGFDNQMREALRSIFESNGFNDVARIDSVKMDESFIGSFAKAYKALTGMNLTPPKAAEVSANLIQRAGFDAVYAKDGDTTTEIVIYDPANILIKNWNGKSINSTFSLSPQSGIDIVSDTLESWQDVFDKAAKRNPTRAMAIRDLAQQRINKLGEMWAADRWTAKGDKIRAVVEKRTKGGLDDEQAMREALRYQELLDAGMDTLTPETLMAYSEGVGTLEDDPLVKKMLHENGRLMSWATASRQNRDIKDQYNDAPWIPPQWYSRGKTVSTAIVTFKDGSMGSYDAAKVPAEVKADIEQGKATVKINKTRTPPTGGIMPDVMANNLGFDTASEMWAALESSIKSHRSAKEGYAKAEAAVKAVEKQAREQAKAEAAAWRQEADDMQADDWSPRESLVRDMRVLNVALSAFPPEVRAKVTGGSMVKLAGLATERARYKAIQKALEKAIVETEVFMRKEYTEQIDKALDSYRSQKDSSGRISGKLPSQYTELVDYAYRIREASIEDQATESGGLEKALEESESDQQTQSVLTKMGILRLFEAWDMKDSTAMAAASEWLSETIENGKLGRKLLDEDRKAMLDDFRATAKKDAVPEGKISKVDVDNETNNVRFKVFRRAWQGLNGMLDSAVHVFGERLSLVFGDDSKITDHFSMAMIQAANASNDIKREVNRKYHDMLSVVFNSRSRLAHARGIGQMQKVKASGILITEGRVVEETKLDIETLTKLADGTMTAEAAGLRQDQVDAALEEWAASERKRTVTVETVKNAGEQKERQMTELQGLQWWLWSRQDASRKQMERDGWTEESFAQLDAFLSPEAKALGEWIAKGYDDAARLIDPVYRRLFRAPLPRVKNYAPIYRNRSGDASVMDLDASDISSGLSAGFTKSRVNTVSPLAEMDAVTVMLTHWENVAHWVTHAEAVRDAKAVLLDRDVMTAIKQSSGNVSANSIKQRIAAIESQGTNAARELVDLSRMWRWIMQYRAFKGLAFRISPVIKQTSALLNPLLADVPAHAYTTGLARAFYDPAAFGRDVAEMFKSDTIMRRVEGGFSAEARIAMQGEGAAGSVALAWMQRGMMPMAWTDAGWTALGAAVSFDYYRRGYISEGMNNAMANAAATKRLEKMIAVSAQPSDVVNRSLIEASSNPFMRSLWMFASDQRKALGIEVTALKKLLSGKSKNKAMDVQRIIVAHVAQAAMSQLMAAWMASLIGDDDDKEREWSREQWTLSLSLGPINGLFVFGRLVDMAGRRILGLRVFPGGNLIEKAADDLVRGGKSMDELFNPDDPEDFINALDALSVGASGVMSMGIGPQAGVVDVTANLVREGNKVIKAMSDKK